MKIPSYKVARLRTMLDGNVPKNILIVSHYNPDGDALGSSIADTSILLQTETPCI